MLILETWHFLTKSCFNDLFLKKAICFYNFVIQIYIPSPTAPPVSTQHASIFISLSNHKMSSLKAYSS